MPDGRNASRANARTDRYGDPLPAGAVARLGTERLRVSGEVVSMAWSPDGKLLAIGQTDRLRREASVTLFETSTGRRLLPDLEADGRARITHLQFSPDSRILTGSGLYGGGKWDAKSGESLSAETAAGHASPDGRIHIRRGRNNRELQVFDTAAGEQVAAIGVEGHDNGFQTYAFSPDGKTLATGTYDGQLHLWNARTGAVKFELPVPKNMVAEVAFTPDGKVLAAAGSSSLKGIHLFDTATGQLVRTIQSDGRPQPINAMAISPDGKWLASGGRDEPTVEVHGIADGRKRTELDVGVDDMKCLAFSPDGSKIAVAAGRAFFGRQRVSVYDLATGKELLVQPGHRGPIERVAFSPDGALIATAGRDGTVRLWEARTGREVVRLSGDGTQALAFSPDGWLLGAADRSGRYTLWEVATATEVVSRTSDVALIGQTAAFAPELGRLAVGTHDGTVVLFDTADGKKQQTIVVQNGGEVADVAFSPDGDGDGRFLAAAPGSRFAARRNGMGAPEVGVWDVETGKKVRTLRNPDVGDDLFRSEFRSLTYSPDGQTIAAVSSNRQLYLWDAGGAGLLKVPIDTGAAVAFSADGRSLAVAPGGRSRLIGRRLGEAAAPDPVRLIEVATGLVYATVPATEHPVSAMAVSPRGDLLATALGEVDNVLVWEIAPPVVEPPDEDSLQEAWDDLSERDAEAAYQAMGVLIAGGDRSVALLESRLQPAEKSPPAERVRELITQLGDESYEVRQQASAALQKIGAEAEPVLRAALDKSTDPELRRRALVLLNHLTTAFPKLAGEPLRRIRAVRVLERVASEPARELLERLADGAPKARETIDAQAALRRIDNLGSGR